MRKTLVNFGLGMVGLSLIVSCGGTGTPIYKSMAKTITIDVPNDADAQSPEGVMYLLDKPHSQLNHGDLYSVTSLANRKVGSLVLYFDSTVGEFGAFRPTGDFTLTSETGTVILSPISIPESAIE